MHSDARPPHSYSPTTQPTYSQTCKGRHMCCSSGCCVHFKRTCQSLSFELPNFFVVQQKVTRSFAFQHFLRPGACIVTEIFRFSLASSHKGVVTFPCAARSRWGPLNDFGPTYPYARCYFSRHCMSLKVIERPALDGSETCQHGIRLAVCCFNLS